MCAQVAPINTFPKLHNAMWPGLVGKGSPGAEPCIDLDTMLALTSKAEVNGTRFDGVDLFLFDPHVSIEIDDEGLKRLADKIAGHGFVVGSVVAPVWPPTGGGSAMGTDEERKRFVDQLRKACRIASRLRDLKVRPYGVVRIDSASSVSDWAKDPDGNQSRIAETFGWACDVAEEYGERLAAEGEICWGGMHSWKRMLQLLERVNRPKTLGFQADMAHTLLYTMGYNAPEDAILPPDWDWSDPQRLDQALRELTAALRPWTIDFHVAQNDATVHGSGTHDKTGHHCLPGDSLGKLRIVDHAGLWLRGEDGEPTRAVRHICWDGCMFPNDVMMRQDTWNDILAAMIKVREAHGWTDRPQKPSTELASVGAITMGGAKKPAARRTKGRFAKPTAAVAKSAKKPKAVLRRLAAKVTKRKAKTSRPPRNGKAKSRPAVRRRRVVPSAKSPGTRKRVVKPARTLKSRKSSKRR